jgi:DNA-binding phage protein
MSIIKEVSEGTALLEVSKALMGRYLKKASRSLHTSAKELGQGEEHYDVQHYGDDNESEGAQLHKDVGDIDQDEYDDHFKNQARSVDKRRKGINMVAKKIAKEEVDKTLEEARLRRRGRPRKARHEDGEIVNDPQANS